MLSYFDRSLSTIKPNILLMILLLMEVEELMKVGTRLLFTFAYLSINFIFLTFFDYNIASIDVSGL